MADNKREDGEIIIKFKRTDTETHMQCQMEHVGTMDLMKAAEMLLSEAGAKGKMIKIKNPLDLLSVIGDIAKDVQSKMDEDDGPCMCPDCIASRKKNVNNPNVN